MFEAEARNAVAQGVQKMVLRVVACAEERARFGDEALIVADCLRRHLQRGLTIAHHVNLVRRFASSGRRELDFAKVGSGGEQT